MQVYAEITGTVCQIEVQPGQTVQEGDTLLIVESMKMEIPVAASAAGVVKAVLVAQGDAVGDDTVVVELA